MEAELEFICLKAKWTSPKTRNAIYEILKIYTPAIITNNSIFEINLTQVAETSPEIINVVYKLIYDNIRALDSNE
jgi:hypothetical protein